MCSSDLWNVEVFGNVEEQGKQMWKDLSKFETIEEICGLTEEEKKIWKESGGA